MVLHDCLANLILIQCPHVLAKAIAPSVQNNMGCLYTCDKDNPFPTETRDRLPPSNSNTADSCSTHRCGSVLHLLLDYLAGLHRGL